MQPFAAPRRALAVPALAFANLLPSQQWLQHTLPPVPGAAAVAIHDVDGTSPNDVWVVGSYVVANSGGALQNTLVMHWDGATWSIEPAPNPVGPGGPYNAYTAVKALATDDVWVGGSWRNLGLNWLPQSDLHVAHWDGSAWTPVVTTAASPNGNGHGITDIVASGPDDVWFLGRVTASRIQALAMHWDGATMLMQFAPPPASAPIANLELRSGAAIAPNDVWLVGGGPNYLGTVPYLVHGDGSTLSVIPGATSGNTYRISSVAALASNDVWVMGEEQAGNNLTLLLWRWNGTSWSPAPQWGPGFWAHTLHAANGVLFAGGLGGVLRWDGAAWVSDTTLPMLPTPSSARVLGNAGSSMFVIAAAGGVPATWHLLERRAGAPATSVTRPPCVGVAPPNSLRPLALPRPGQPWSVACGDPSDAAQMTAGATQSFWVASWSPAAGQPCGVLAPWAGFGGRPAELLIDPSPASAAVIDSPRVWNGPASPAVHTVQVPAVPGLIGLSLFTQGALVDLGTASPRIVLTHAVDFTVGS